MSRRTGRGSLKLGAIALAIVAVGVAVDWNQLQPEVKALFGRLTTKAETVGAPTVPQRAPAVPVTAAQAKAGDLPVVLTGLGNVQPFNTVVVRTRVDGQIVKIHFGEGDLVHEGDPLAEIDARPFQAALDQVLAKKQQDQASIDNAKRDLGRYQALAKSDFATRQQLDTQTATVAQLTAQLASDEASILNARTQLDYTRIKAPLTGRTGFRLVDQGNIVNAAGTSGIVSIAEIEPIAVVFTAPEGSLPEIKSGLDTGPLDVSAFSSDGRRRLADGKLTFINNEIDTASGTIRLKAAFDNKNHDLWPGLSVATKLTVAIRKNVVLVPASAIQRSQNGLFVFVIRSDDKVDQRSVKVGATTDDRTIVEDGVKAGERIVTGGQYRLQQNTLVKTTPAGAEQTSQRDS